MATGIKDKVAIIGMGCSKFGERWDMGAEELEECPFLGLRREIHVADLKLIPEKYRLDVARVEELLARFLKAWLAELEGDPSSS